MFLLFLFIFKAQAQICVGQKPTQKYYANFTVLQTVPKGTEMQNIETMQNSYNASAEARANDYFLGLRDGNYLTITAESKAKFTKEVKTIPTSKVVRQESQIIRTEDASYTVCRVTECGDIENKSGRPSFFEDFKKFFSEHEVKPEIFNKAVTVNKKIENNYVIYQVTFDPTEICKDAKNNSIHYSDN